MEMTRRELLTKSGKFILLTSAAATAWEYVLAGKAEASPNYDMTKHWWAMIIDPEKCIGCGNCVRACEAENDVPPGYFRTWIERYHVDDYDLEHPQVDSPNGGHDGFPEKYKDGGKTFFVPKLCNHCADSPCVQVCPVGATFVHARWRGPGGPEVLPRLPLLHSGLPLRLPLSQPQDQYGRQMHAVLPPHHEGPDHRVLRSLSHAGARAGRSEESQGSDPRIPENA